MKRMVIIICFIAVVIGSVHLSGWVYGQPITPGGTWFFKYLHDTPNSFTDEGGNYVTVNASGTALEFTSGSFVSDVAYSSAWNGTTTTAPSMNAVYDILHQYDTDDDGDIDNIDGVVGGGDITAVGDGASGNVFTAAGSGTTLYFEGSTWDAFDLELTTEDLTTNVKVTLRAATGTVLISGDTFAGDVTAAFGTSGAHTLTIAANSVALATDTTGNFVATIADSGSTTITVTGSGSEAAAVTIGVPANGIKLAQLDVSDVSDDIAGDIAAGELTDDSVNDDDINWADLTYLTTNGAGIDEAYSAGWNGDVGPPEKDDVYDYLVKFDADADGSFTDENWLTQWTGSASITTLGTIGTGVWNAGAVTSSGTVEAATGIKLSDDATITQSADNYVTTTENSDKAEFYFDGTNVELQWSDGLLILRGQEDGVNTGVSIYGKDAGERGHLYIFSDGGDKSINMYHDDTDSQLTSGSGDLYLTAAGGDINLGDDNLTTTGTLEAATITEGGIAVITEGDMPAAGTDPDVDAAGEIGRDTDDHSLRGYDGSNQYLYSAKDKPAQFTIANPDLLSESDNLVVWTNNTAFTFNLTEIQATSDTDDATFTLKEVDADGANATTIEAVTISTDGTNLYYTTVAVGDIDHTAIEAGHRLMYDASAFDTDYIHIALKGYFDADVN